MIEGKLGTLNYLHLKKNPEHSNKDEFQIQLCVLGHEATEKNTPLDVYQEHSQYIVC